MARKKKHEEHVNAEAWAIPYGDLVTLLFALFTVMYAMSSVNEGKFRVLSDSLIAAFHGAPKSVQPVNIGEKEPGKGGDKPLVGLMPTALMKIKEQKAPEADAPRDPNLSEGHVSNEAPGALIRMEREVQNAMQALIDAKLVTIRRESMWLEIEINTDILFPSGSGAFAPAAEPVLDKLADVLKPFPHQDRRLSVQLGVVRCPVGERGAPIHQGRHRSAAPRDRRVRGVPSAPKQRQRRGAQRQSARRHSRARVGGAGRSGDRHSRRQRARRGRTRRRNGRCERRGKSATMARAAVQPGKDGTDEGSSEARRGGRVGCSERCARGGKRFAALSVIEVSHGRS
jgi:flagellar motor protein MotB